MLYACKENGKVQLITPVSKKFKPKTGWLKVSPKTLPSEDVEILDIVDGALVIDEDLKNKKQERDIREARRKDYPAVGDALDALAKWAFSETEIGLPKELKSWAAKCMSVKSKYPKKKK